LISFSFKLVSDQFVIGSGVASVRKKLPRSIQDKVPMSTSESA
jgi:hypothetical protein